MTSTAVSGPGRVGGTTGRRGKVAQAGVHQPHHLGAQGPHRTGPRVRGLALRTAAGGGAVVRVHRLLRGNQDVRPATHDRHTSSSFLLGQIRPVVMNTTRPAGVNERDLRWPQPATAVATPRAAVAVNNPRRKSIKQTSLPLFR